MTAEPLFFTHTPAEGLTSLSRPFTTGPWASIDTAPWTTADRTLARPLRDTPVLAVFKLQATWAIDELVAAREAAASAKDADKAWDEAERSFSALVKAAASSSDPKKREAAGRLKKTMLQGGGAGQTKLKYRKEVDFGRNQVKMAAEGQTADDVKLLGLQPAVDEISEKTEAFALVLDHDEGHHLPSARLERALAACRATIGFIADQLAWMAERAQPGDDRQLALALREPLAQLAARYPAPATAKAAAAAAPAAPATPPPATPPADPPAKPDDSGKPTG